ncbi:MAG: Npt1/Npt2 family nucleotide transporter [Acidobacteriota bacterium]
MNTPGSAGDLARDGGRFRRSLEFAGGFRIRRAERSVASLFFVYFFLLMASEYAVKSVRQASYIDIVGAQNLPYVYLLLALLSFPALVLYSKLTRRFDDPTLIVAFAILRILGLVVFFWLFGHTTGWLLAFAFYVWSTLGFGVAVSQFWSFANNVFDARQARRLFAFVGAGGLLGGVPGGQIARLVTAWAGTRYTLLAASLLLVVVVTLVILINRTRPHSESETGSAHRLQVRQDKVGFEVLRGSRLLGLIAVLMLLMVVVSQTVDLQFNWVIQQHTTTLDQRTSVMGNFFTLMGVIGFIFQLLFTQRIHRALGVGVGMRVLPATVGLTTVLLLLSFGLFPAAVLFFAWTLRLSETSLRHSVEQATRELLFLPVSPDLRRRAKGFIDVFVQRLGEGVGALLLFPVTFALVGVAQVGWLTLALVVLWLWVTVAARREYVATFRRGLKPGASDRRAAIDTRDLVTLTTLIQSLGSTDARQVMLSLELLMAYGEGKLVNPLLLHHQDPGVRCKTLEVLAEAGRTDVLPLIEQRLTDESAGVRCAAVRAVAALRGEDAAEMLLPRLADEDLRLRTAAVACLAGHSDRAVVEQALGTLNRMLADDNPGVREEAAKALGQIREPAESGCLITLLYDRDPRVVRQAIAAVHARLARDGENPIYIPTLISLMANRRLKHEARDAVVAFGEGAIPAVVAFMNDNDEGIWVRRALPKTLAMLGGEAAFSALSGLLLAPDAILREKVIEAMVSLRSRQPGLRVRSAQVQRQIRVEAIRYLRALSDLWAVGSMYEATLEGPVARWRSAGRVPSLLQEVLAQRMSGAVKNVAGMLELLLPPRDVRAAFRSLSSPDASLRAQALEYLDNTLRGSLRRDVFAVIDDAPAEEKLRKAEQEFGVPFEGLEQTIERLIGTDIETDPSAVGLVVAAIHAVHVGRTRDLHPLLRQMAVSGTNPLLRETAGWVLAQEGTPAAGSATAVLDGAPGR